MATTPYYEIVDVVVDAPRNEIVDVFVDEHVDDVNALIDYGTRDYYAEVLVVTTDGEAQARDPWKSYLGLRHGPAGQDASSQYLRP